MFPTGSTTVPADSTALHAALASGIAPLGLGPAAISLEGVFPSLGALRIDLSGARISRKFRTAMELAEEKTVFFSRLMEVTAAPAYFETLPFHLALHAEDCTFSSGVAGDGTRVIRPADCSSASATLSAEIADIEAALLAAGRSAAAAKGAELESVRLSLTATDRRNIEVTAVATARAMLFAATLTIRGRVAIDDQFDAQFAGLDCSGDGVIANLAAGYIRPGLAKLEGRRFSIARLLPDALEPADVAFAVTPSLRLQITIRRKRHEPAAVQFVGEKYH